MTIRAMEERDADEVVRMSLLVWAPVFASFELVLGSAIYRRIYPDWEASQRAAVTAVCLDTESIEVWVATVGEPVAGFIAIGMDQTSRAGEVEPLAVHLGHQGRGIGTALNTFALARMREAGMRLAVAGTGGDPGHAPGRRSYENAGYTGLPMMRYYRDL